MSRTIESTYVHLDDAGAATAIPVTDSFWPDLSGGRMPQLEQGRLVTQFSFAQDWDKWEMHPEGEEVVVLLSGSVEFVLDQGGDERKVALREPGAFVIVPRGAWHRALTKTPTSMLFITAGRGTTHRPIEKR